MPMPDFEARRSGRLEEVWHCSIHPCFQRAAFEPDTGSTEAPQSPLSSETEECGTLNPSVFHALHFNPTQRSTEAHRVPEQ